MWILNILLLIIILGIIILIHEIGHFMWAKKFGVHIYEFSLGMGPVLKVFKGKDGIDYKIRALPIGGFVAMAGEVYDDDENVKKEDLMCNKKWYQRLIILIAGVVNNYILAIVTLFVIALIWGATSTKPVISEIIKDSGFSKAISSETDKSIEIGDEIIALNGVRTASWDKLQIALFRKNSNEAYEFVVKKSDGKKYTYKVVPTKEKNEDGTERNVFGFGMRGEEQKGILASIKFAFAKFAAILDSMMLTITSLFSGKISLNSLSGPVGMYEVVGQSVSVGISQVIYIMAFLSINVGFINILPFPAFDGGRVLFLIIEKIKGSPINSKIENTFHTVGFFLLILLMIYITIQDIIKFF